MNVLILVGGGAREVAEVSRALHALRSRLPGARITLAVPPHPPSPADALLDEADTIVQIGALASRISLFGMAMAWLRLRRLRTDVVVVASRRRADRVLAYALGIPRRLGVGGMRPSPLLTDSVPGPSPNDASAWMEVVELVGGGQSDLPRRLPTPAAARRIRTLLAEREIDPERVLIALAPRGASDGPATEHWPPECFAQLGNQLGIRHGAAVVLVGGEADRAAINATLADLAAPHADLCGELDPSETAALLARCDLLVGEDSPLLHVAATLDTPTIGLFGATDGRRHGASGSEHRILQAVAQSSRQRREGMLQRIRVDDVIAAIEATF